MIMGDDSLLLRDVREEFQQTGVYHLLVVSGMNVALLAFALFWLARRLRLPQWPASLLTIVLSIFYAYIAGMGVPIMRAVLMLSLFLVARLLYRDRSGLNATGFAALVVLVLSPAALFEPGFQLTFLALLAITGISLPILERTSSPYRSALKHLDTTGYDLGLEPKLAQFRLDLRLVSGRVQQFVGERAAQFIVTGGSGAILALFEFLRGVCDHPGSAGFADACLFSSRCHSGCSRQYSGPAVSGIDAQRRVAAIALSYVSLPFARLAATLAAGSLHWTLAVFILFRVFMSRSGEYPDPHPSPRACWQLRESSGFLRRAKATQRSRLPDWPRYFFPAEWSRYITPRPRSRAASWKLQPLTWAREIPCWWSLLRGEPC